MKQIPLTLLPDYLEVSVLDDSADYGGEFFPAVFVENVRFELKESLDPKEYQLAENAKGRIWIDAVNSEGAFAIPEGSQAAITKKDGTDYRMQVLTCATYEQFNGVIHHWEVDVG